MAHAVQAPSPMGSARPRFARLSRRASPSSSASHTAASIRPAHAARPSCPCLSGPSSASPMAVSIRRAHVTRAESPSLPRRAAGPCAPRLRPQGCLGSFSRTVLSRRVERRPQPRPRSRLMRPALGPSLMPGVERLALSLRPTAPCPPAARTYAASSGLLRASVMRY